MRLVVSYWISSWAHGKRALWDLMNTLFKVVHTDAVKSCSKDSSSSRVSQEGMLKVAFLFPWLKAESFLSYLRLVEMITRALHYWEHILGTVTQIWADAKPEGKRACLFTVVKRKTTLKVLVGWNATKRPNFELITVGPTMIYGSSSLGPKLQPYIEYSVKANFPAFCHGGLCQDKDNSCDLLLF